MRNYIQSKLQELSDIEIGAEIPDDLLEEGKTYFSYNLSKNYVNCDYDNQTTYRVNCIGYVKRLTKSNENTLEIVDETADTIVCKLKEINMHCSYEDVSIANGVQKNRITGYGTYNEINNKFV